MSGETASTATGIGGESLLARARAALETVTDPELPFLTIADMGIQGGIPGHDGQWDNNDFIVFIDQFFAAC